MTRPLAVAGTVIAAVCGLTLSACGNGTSNAAGGTGGGQVTIGISFDKMVAFREGEKKFLEKAAKDLGVKLIYQDAENDAQRQSQQVATLISQGAKGVAVMPFDPQAIRADIESAKARGVTVTSFDQAPADLSWVSYFVGGNPLADGKAAAAEFVRIANGKPFKLLELQGALNSDNGIKRSKGLHDGLQGHDNIKIVAQVPTDWNPEPALTGIENTLQKTPDLNGIYLPTDGEIPPAFSALKAVNKLKPVGEAGHVAIVSIDGDPVGCKAVRDKFVDMVLATDVPSMTKDVLQQTLNGINGKPVAKSEFLPGIPITPDTVASKAAVVWGCAS